MLLVAGSGVWVFSAARRGMMGEPILSLSYDIAITFPARNSEVAGRAIDRSLERDSIERGD